MIQNLNITTLMENVAERSQAFYDVSILLLCNYICNKINISSNFRSGFNVLMELCHFTNLS